VVCSDFTSLSTNRYVTLIPILTVEPQLSYQQAALSGFVFMPVLRDWDLKLSIEDVLRAQGARNISSSPVSSEISAAAERALREGMPLLQPAAAYAEYRIQSIKHERASFSEGGGLSGRNIVLHLAAARTATVVICTVGGIIDEFVKAVFKSDPLYALALDGLGSAAITALSERVCSFVADKAAARGWETTLPLSPGSDGWPAGKGNQELFDLVDVSEAGITLTQSGMMVPLKSLSMVLGSGPEVDNSGRVCDYCTMKNSCRYQDNY
jgi:hypothetical protein